MKEKYVFENNFLRVKECKWGYFAFNNLDKYIGKSLNAYGEWCEAELDLLGALIKENGAIIDVGANIGTHTLFFSKKVPQGFVIAIEPQRLIFQQLATNITLNCLENVYAYQAAAGDQEGTIAVPNISPHSEFNFGAVRLDRYKQGEKTTLTTIDSLNLGNIDLIKIDVEGMEVRVLRGACKSIKKFHPIIFIENNTTEDSSAIISALYAMDYRCWWHIASYFNKNNYFENKNNIFSLLYPEANLICLHKNSVLPHIELIEVEGEEDNWVKATNRLLKFHNGKSLNFTLEEYSLMQF